AFMPEPNTLLMVVQPAASGMPAARDAWRAGACPRPAGSTQPMMVSSTWSGLIPACSSAPLMAAAPRVGVGTPLNWPRKEPMAVRLAPRMTMSLMTAPPVEGEGMDRLSGLCCPAANAGSAPALADRFITDRAAAHSSGGRDAV